MYLKLTLELKLQTDSVIMTNAIVNVVSAYIYYCNSSLQFA